MWSIKKKARYETIVRGNNPVIHLIELKYKGAGSGRLWRGPGIMGGRKKGSLPSAGGYGIAARREQLY